MPEMGARGGFLQLKDCCGIGNAVTVVRKGEHGALERRKL
jgi:hypothetical protein